MTDFEEAVLFAALEREVSAWELLHDPEVASKLTSEEMLNLCLRAGYPEEASQKAAREHGYKRMQAELPP